MLKSTLEKGDNKSNVPRIESGKKKDYKTDYSHNFKGELYIKNLYIYQEKFIYFHQKIKLC